jgi:glycosyltransferase involved in cell wall biosynthesis
VFDNGSTDGSLELLQQHSDLITVKHFDTPEGKDNAVMANLKNECWKASRGQADLVVVCDLDEMLIPVSGALRRMLNSSATICRPLWYDLVSEQEPTYHKGILLHEERPMAAYLYGSKAVIFNPNKIEETNYGVGAHTCEPQGDVRWYGGGDMYLLHVNHNLSLEYKVNRYKILNERRGPNDVKYERGVHYHQTAEQIAAGLERNRKAAVNLFDVMRWYDEK